jgi:hypothetical protein
VRGHKIPSIQEQKGEIHMDEILDNQEPEVDETLEDQVVDELHVEEEVDLLADALRQIQEANEADEDDNEDEIEETEQEEDEHVDESEVDEVDTKEEDHTHIDENNQQSPEDNARFAEQRRQRDFDTKFAETTEYKMARELAESYGMSVEQLYDNMKQAKLQEEAEKQGVPVEYLRSQQEQASRIETLERQLFDQQFNSWKSNVTAQGAELQKAYPMLSAKEFEEAENYLLNVARNPDMPLKQAVWALHGEKIIEAQTKKNQNDSLAEKAGRKTPVVPNGGKPKENAGGLTDAELAMANKLGMTPKEYLKYK